MYTNDIAELRKLREQRYRESRQKHTPQSESRASSPVQSTADVEKQNALKFQQKYGCDGKRALPNGGVQSLKSNKLLSFALQAKDEIQSLVHRVASRLIENDTEKEDKCIIERLKKAEKSEKNQRKARLNEKREAREACKKAQVSSEHRESFILPVPQQTSLFSCLNTEISESSDGEKRPVQKLQAKQWYKLHASDTFRLYSFFTSNAKESQKMQKGKDAYLKRAKSFASDLRRVSPQRLKKGVTRPPLTNFLTEVKKFEQSKNAFIACARKFLHSSNEKRFEEIRDKCLQPEASHHKFFALTLRVDGAHEKMHISMQLSLAVRNVLIASVLQSASAISSAQKQDICSLEQDRDHHEILCCSEEKAARVLRTLSDFGKRTHVVILLRAGEAAFAVFEDQRPVLSKVIKKYVSRRAQGSSQFLKDGGFGSSRVQYSGKIANADMENTSLEQENSKSLQFSFNKKKTKSGGRRKNGCRSVGAQIRRLQFDEFVIDTQGFLASETWRSLLAQSEAIWIACTNLELAHHIFYTPKHDAYEKILHDKVRMHQSSALDCVVLDDPRVHRVPISTRRPTFSEACRCYLEMTSIQISAPVAQKLKNSEQ